MLSNFAVKPEEHGIIITFFNVTVKVVLSAHKQALSGHCNRSRSTAASSKCGRRSAIRVKLRIVDHFGRAAVLDRRLRNKKIMKYFVLAESFGILTAKFEN